MTIFARLFAGLAVFGGLALSATAASVTPVYDVQRIPIDHRYNGRISAIALRPGPTIDLVLASETGGFFRGSPTRGYRRIEVAPRSIPANDAIDAAFVGIGGTRVILGTVKTNFDTDLASGLLATPGVDTGAVLRQVPLTGPDGCAASEGIGAYGITAIPNPNVRLDDTVLVGTDCGLAVKQSGAAWTVMSVRTDTDRALPAVYSVVAADPDVTDGTARLVATTSRGLRVTDDFGRTWRTVPAGDRVYLGEFPRTLATDPMDPSIVYLASLVDPDGPDSNGNSDRTTAELAISTDAGSSFAPVAESRTVPTGCGGNMAVRTFRIDADTIELLYSDRCHMRRIRCDGATGAARAAACRANVAAAANMPSPHVDTRDVVRRPGDPVRYYLSSDGGLHVSADDGATFATTRTATGLDALQVYRAVGRYEWPLRPDGRHELYIGTQDNFFLASLDDGRTWGDGDPASDNQGDYLAPTEGFHDGFERDHETAIDSAVNYCNAGQRSPCPTMAPPAYGDSGLTLEYPNANGGETVVVRRETLWTGPPGSSGLPIRIGRRTYIQESVINVGTDTAPRNRISWAMTTDNGQTWTTILPDVPQRMEGAFSRVIGQDPVTVFVTTEKRNGHVNLMRMTFRADGSDATFGYLFRDADGVWRMPVLTGHHFMWEGVFDVDPADPAHIFVVANATASSFSPDGDAVRESTDGGVTWRRRSDVEALLAGYRPPSSQRGVNLRLVRFNPWDPRRVVIGTRDAGLLYSFDGGRTFERIRNSEQIGPVTSVLFQSDSTMVVSSYGRGIWRVQARLHWTGLTTADVCPYPKGCRYFDGFKLTDGFPIEDLSTIDNLITTRHGPIFGYAARPGSLTVGLSSAASYETRGPVPSERNRMRIVVDGRARTMPAAVTTAIDAAGLVPVGLIQVAGRTEPYVIATSEAPVLRPFRDPKEIPPTPFKTDLAAPALQVSAGRTFGAMPVALPGGRVRLSVACANTVRVLLAGVTQRTMPCRSGRAAGTLPMPIPDGLYRVDVFDTKTGRRLGGRHVAVAHQDKFKD